MLYRIQYIRTEALWLRARCQLAVAARATGGAREKHLRNAERDARRLERENMPWSLPMVSLLRAALANLRGQRDHVSALLAEADTGFFAAQMNLFATAARRRRGLLIGGDEGRRLVVEADAWMTAQTILAPERMIAVYTPGLDDRE